MRIFHGGAILASTAALLFAAGCGSSSSSSGTAAAPPSAATSASGSGFAAFTDCLRQHGVTIPTARPSGGNGRPGGGAFGSGGNRQAVQACMSLAPRFQNRGGLQELQAFRSCMSDHGVALPTPSPGAFRSPGGPGSPGARRPGTGGRLGGLNTTDPKVAKAMQVCRPLLPSFTPRPSQG